MRPRGIVKLKRKKKTKYAIQTALWQCPVGREPTAPRPTRCWTLVPLVSVQGCHENPDQALRYKTNCKTLKTLKSLGDWVAADYSCPLWGRCSPSRLHRLHTAFQHPTLLRLRLRAGCIDYLRAAF